MRYDMGEKWIHCSIPVRVTILKPCLEGLCVIKKRLLSQNRIHKTLRDGHSKDKICGLGLTWFFNAEATIR
jgi:hypothetical protein